MNIVAHASVGWLLAESGRGDARFRRAVFLAAVLADLDGVTYLFGSSASLYHHHVWMHNLVFSLLVSLVAVWSCKQQKASVVLFTQLAFYSHYFGDYFFTTWPLAFFWPFSHQTFISKHAFAYFSNINTVFVYCGCLLLLILAVLFKRTPLEVLSPKLDRWLVGGVTGLFKKPCAKDAAE